MPRLPRVSGREARRAFERAGWTHSRTTGDHMILTMPGKRSLVIPDYDDLPAFILRGLIRTAGISLDEFIALLK
jgi:predicted RNA binding protein YcfA (HicA-like mRNA interferase family)